MGHVTHGRLEIGGGQKFTNRHNPWSIYKKIWEKSIQIAGINPCMIKIVSFRTDRSGQTSEDPEGAVWSGSSLCAIPSAAF